MNEEDEDEDADEEVVDGGDDAAALVGGGADAGDGAVATGLLKTPLDVQAHSVSESRTAIAK